MNSDELWLGTLLNGEARFVIAGTTHAVAEAAGRHQTTPVATAAVGRLMTAALLLASSLKGEETITLRVLGDGPLGGAVTVANAAGEVRGYVHEPQVELPLTAQGKLDVAGAVGQGKFVVSRSLANGETYNGLVPLVSGEIGEDLVHYLMNSEQIPSVALLGVLVETDYRVAGAGGLLIQLLPDASETTIQAIEHHLEKISKGISLIASESNTMEEFTRSLMGDLPFQVLEKRPLNFKCTCSKERVGGTLISIGREGFEEILEDKQAELVCHFCNEKYLFDEVELQTLYQQIQ